MQHLEHIWILMWEIVIVQYFREEFGTSMHINVYAHYDAL
jgi:hypothetical protein